MNFEKRQKLVVILGPTSSGKTGLAQKLCKAFNGYIISADSRQVYKYLDIGTGKVDNKEELKELRRQRQRSPEYYIFNGVQHYMIDVAEPWEDYNVAGYKEEVCQILRNYELRITNYELNNSMAIPFLVGGTGLYIDAVIDNWQFPEGEPNYDLRVELEKRIESQGVESVWNELIARDPLCADFVQKQNPRRVVRALEYMLSTGKKFSEERGKGERQFDVLKIGIKMPREELYKRIDARVEERLKLGLIEEVYELHDKHGLSSPRICGFGLEYRVIGKQLKIKNSKLKIIEKDLPQLLKWTVHAYARRQLTWFRKDKEINWVSGYEEAEGLVKRFL